MTPVTKEALSVADKLIEQTGVSVSVPVPVSRTSYSGETDLNLEPNIRKAQRDAQEAFATRPIKRSNLVLSERLHMMLMVPRNDGTCLADDFICVGLDQAINNRDYKYYALLWNRTEGKLHETVNLNVEESSSKKLDYSKLSVEELQQLQSIRSKLGNK